MTGVNISSAAGLQPPILVKSEILHEYFLIFLMASADQLFCRARLGGCISHRKCMCYTLFIYGTKIFKCFVFFLSKNIIYLFIHHSIFQLVRILET